LKARADIPEFLFYAIDRNKYFLAFDDGAQQTNLRKDDILKCLVAVPPTLREQSAIASVLSDADALITNLKNLIAKKRNIRKGAMQQLLTGKKRLPGFSGEWKTTNLGTVAEFYHGRGLSKDDLREEGSYKCIHYGQLFTIYKELIREVKNRTITNVGYFRSTENDVLMPTSDVTPRGLATASCIKEHGVVLGGGIVVIRFHNGYDGLFFCYFVTQNRTSILKLVKGSTVFHLYATDLANLEIHFPEYQEQIAISQVLSDMDEEIEALENKLSKYRLIKKGMMQELLTGRKRLI
jgi:type I restriction enzyme S subunit